jgi:hypothetical protein
MNLLNTLSSTLQKQQSTLNFFHSSQKAEEQSTHSMHSIPRPLTPTSLHTRHSKEDGIATNKALLTRRLNNMNASIMAKEALGLKKPEPELLHGLCRRLFASVDGVSNYVTVY